MVSAKVWQEPILHKNWKISAHLDIFAHFLFQIFSLDKNIAKNYNAGIINVAFLWPFYLPIWSAGFVNDFFLKQLKGFNFVERPDKESSDVFWLRWNANE